MAQTQTKRRNGKKTINHKILVITGVVFVMLLACAIKVGAFENQAEKRLDMVRLEQAKRLDETTGLAKEGEILLQATNPDKQNRVDLSWNAPNQEHNWTYRLYQRMSGETEFETVSTKYDKAVKVLNIYPDVGDNLQEWMKKFGKGLIDVDKVSIDDFNSQPEKYLKDQNGNYQYDVLMFGSWDHYNYYDLSNTAYSEVEKWIKTGRGVLFGHDTILRNSGEVHPTFNQLAHYVNIDAQVGRHTYKGTNITVTKSGYLTKYPWNIGEEGTKLVVPYCHTVNQVAYGRIWMRYSWQDQNDPLNFYLTSYNNCAMIQTGHSKGEATEDEQKVIANTLFYLGQVTQETHASSYTAEDLAAPDKPTVQTRELPEGGYNLQIDAKDNGTTYEHYVTGTDENGNVVTSNTTTTTVTSGIAGYSWSIGNDDPENTVMEIPSHFGEEYEGKTIRIRAIDRAGNASEVSTVTFHKKGKIVLRSEYKMGNNYTDLYWNAPDQEHDWNYRLYQKTQGEDEFETVSTRYDKPVKVLNIYPNRGDQLQEWMKNFGKGLIDVDKVNMINFNQNPSAYLIDGNGKYKYDVLMFGSWDNNGQGDKGGNIGYDLSDIACNEVEKYIKTGRGVLFGHDTVCLAWHDPHPNFVKLQSYLNMTTTYNTGRTFNGHDADGKPLTGETIKGAISTITINQSGYLTKYPWNIGEVGTNLYIPFCHTGYQTPHGRIWMRYNYNNMYLNDPMNFYLTSYNNCAMIQTGHSNGAATEDEQKVIANTLFYLGQLSHETNAHVRTAEDLAAPDKPDVKSRALPKGGYQIKFSTKDNGTTYEHYVEGIDESGNIVRSNTVSTTVITGLKGYSWTVNDEEPDNTVEDLPTYFGQEYAGKILRIKAIDNAGNASETVSVLLDKNEFIDAFDHGRIYLESRYTYGNNYTDLYWNAPGNHNKWSYRLYQNKEGEGEYESVSTRYDKAVKVLNIYPNAGNQLQNWMRDYGRGLIDVDKVSIDTFNSHPEQYLKDQNGDYKYDVLMFGSWDANNDKDLTYNASLAVEKYIKTGRGVLFGHDTTRRDGSSGLSNFNRLAGYVKMDLQNGGARYDGHNEYGNFDHGGTSTVMITKAGYLTKYPWNIGDLGTNLYVPRCHTVYQIPHGRIWMRFNYQNKYLNDPGNFYLTSWNNCAMIQTGHSSGAATPDEQRVIANTLFYLGQVTKETYAHVRTAEDLAAPDAPSVRLTQRGLNQEVYQIGVSGKDNGTTYHHYVEGIDENGRVIRSNTTTTTIITGIAGYSWVIDQQPNTEPDNQIDGLPGEITRSQEGMYLHIKAIDGAGNVGPTLHYQLIIPKIQLYNDRYQVGMNDVPLHWDNSDGRNPYRYHLYHKAESEGNYSKIKELDERETTDETANDHAAPGLPDAIFSPIKEDKQKIRVTIQTDDYGTGYDHFVEAHDKNSGSVFYSNDVYTTVTSGIQGYTWIIDNKKTTEPSKDPKDIQEVPATLDRSYIGKWLHIRAIDRAGNAGPILHIEIDDSRRIPEEEVDQSKYLYCIANGVHIPARANGTNLDATVESGGLKQYVENPYKGQIIGETYVADGLNLQNPYRDTTSHSIGKYYGTVPPKREGKEGNAKDEEAYILSFLDENNSLHSQSQLAMYAIGINAGEAGKDNSLSLEAKEYAKYRTKIDEQGGYKTSQKKLSIMVGYDEKSEKFIVGPFQIDYLRSYTKVGGQKVVFSGIKEVNLYDQNQQKIDGSTWEFVYDDTTKLKNRNETYEEYRYPYPNEPFYLLIDEKANPDLQEITKIEVKHQEMDADAMYTIYEGTYNEIEWKAKYRTNRCEGGAKCPHGMASEHVIGHTYYLQADKVTLGRTDSQKLIEVDWAKRYYREHIQNLDLKLNGNGDKKDDSGTDPGKDPGSDPGKDPGTNPDDNKDDSIRLTMDFEGNIWDDQNEMIANGIKEKDEKGIQGVRVTLYPKGGNQPTTKVGTRNPTYTDAEGNYKFEKVRAGLYDIEYTYDGQTYRTTKFLTNGTVQDYLENPKKELYQNNSKVLETAEARQTLNNRYYEISPFGAIGTDGKKTELEYRENGIESKIVTQDENNVSKEQYEINSQTSSQRIYYPIEQRKYINGVGYLKLSNQKNINVGLAEREKTNENLKLDVYESTFSIKGMTQKFMQSKRNIRDENHIQNVEEYIQKINRADYNWRWDDSLKEVWAKPEECELEAYIDYMIIIRNSGENDRANITELADYYSKDLMYSNDPYRDIDMTSWAVIKPEHVTESESTDEQSRIKVVWSDKSKYGQNNLYPEYNKMYTNSLENLGIEKGKYLEVHIVFKVIKDQDGIKLDEQGDGKKNFAEVNGYRNFNKSDGTVAGLIDLNSKPGDLNPRENPSLYEDDEDKAPNYKLQLDYNNGDNGGKKDDGSGGGSGSDGSGGKIDTDEDGNPRGYGNTVEGNVWDDLRNGSNVVKLANGQTVGDGIRQANEPLINQIRIQLYETFENPKTGAKLTKPIREIRTGKELSLSNRASLDGGYRFSQLASGKYHVEFAYGEEEQLQQDLKYNGQDYQGVKTDEIYQDQNAVGQYDEIEIMLGIDISNSMSGEPIEQEKRSAKELTKKLSEKLPGVKIGLVAYNQDSWTVGKLGGKQEDLESAIDTLQAGGETSILKAMQLMEKSYSSDSKKKIMVLLTDGRPTQENEEEVSKEIESASDQSGIDLISILTKDADAIFGTVETPRRGKVYRIQSNRIYEEIVGNIYQEILEESIVKQDRSYGKDVEEERKAQIEKFTTFNYDNASLLDIDNIREMADGEEKQNAIRELAKATKMTAKTDFLKFRPNNTGKDKVEQINLGLRERPKVELSMEQEVVGIKVTLSDGKVLIDTAKGVNKNVNGLEKADEKVPISVYLDEELMQGTEIQVTYQIKIRNSGEIDKMSNYITGESDATIPTTADYVYEYVNQNMVMRQEYQGSDMWSRLETKDANKISKHVLKEVTENNIQIFQTDGLRAELYPVGSKEAEDGKPTETIGYLVLSKIISPQDDNATLSFENSLEIVQRSNLAGRRAYRGIPGNYVPNSDTDEVDNTRARKVNITRPLGGHEKPVFFVVGAMVILVLTGGIILILRKKDSKHTKEKK